MRHWPIFAFACGIAFLFAGVSFAQPLPTHRHARLMHYLDDAGAEQPVATPADWERRRLQILTGMQEAMGPLPTEMRRGVADAPAPAPLDVRVVETVEQEGIPRQTISFAARNGERVTAYVWVPKGIPPGELRAAMLALHPTGEPGKGIVAGNGKENRAYGLELAQQGYIVIAPDYVSFGDQKAHDFTTDDYASGTMKGIVDHMRCVDYLQSRDDIDPQQIGVIGHSLGGHNAMFVAAFDPRIKAIVASCGWDPAHHYYDGKKLANWAQQRYMPWIVEKFDADADKLPFDFYEVVAALAPRPFYTNSPLHDSNFQYQGVKKAVRAAREVYALFGAPLALQARYPDTAHDFAVPQRREAYAFLERALGHKPTAHVLPFEVGERTVAQIKSTTDGTDQPSIIITPTGYDPSAGAAGIFVSLHSWSGEFTQRDLNLEEAANKHNLILVSPNFRGPNRTPQACGSPFAQQDVLDAIDFVERNYKLTTQDVFLTGSSGGGHMTLQMVGNHPARFTAASAWVGPTDLVAWHEKHRRDNYGAMVRASCGGSPGTSAAVDAQYRYRSPVTHLGRAVNVPLEIAAGVYDGHAGSVPVRHSFEAYNAVAKANEAAAASSDGGAASPSNVVDEATIEKYSEPTWWLNAPGPDDEPSDPLYDRTIYFRRTSGNCRLTLFEGGHERLPDAAFAWLMSHATKK